MVVRLVGPKYMVFGSYWTQVGPKFSVQELSSFRIVHNPPGNSLIPLTKRFRVDSAGLTLSPC